MIKLEGFCTLKSSGSGGGNNWADAGGNSAVLRTPGVGES